MIVRIIMMIVVVRHSARVSPLVTAPPPLPQNTVIGPDQVGRPTILIDASNVDVDLSLWVLPDDPVITIIIII